jgi:hypothetical protein
MASVSGTPVTTGVLGRRWRATVTPWGGIEPWDGGRALDWYVAADDRWHVPRAETSVRQCRIEGTAVVETRVRVPSGDAVGRVWSTADIGGLTVVEVHNDSSLPIAVAFDRGDVLTSRPPTEVAPMGIELPPGSIVLPVGHQARVRVALAHDGRGAGPLPGDLPDADAVVRGWLRRAERASRLVLPQGGAGDVVAARCEVSLTGPDDADEDPVAFVLGVGELVRMGDDAAAWVVDVARAVERIARADAWDVAAALDAAAIVFAAAGERRAVADVARIVAARRPQRLPAEMPAGVRIVAWSERHCARGADVLPDGLPASWYGVAMEAHGLSIGPATTLSYALRWHGERVAILWEQTGEPLTLRAPAIAPSWSSPAPSGEALWLPPAPP